MCLNEKNIYLRKDKNLKFISTNANGIGKKRNIAVKHSKTKYIAFLDSDAYPKKGWIESSFKLIKKKDVGIIGGPHIDPLKQNDEEKLIGKTKLSHIITMKAHLQKKTKSKGQFVNFLPSCNWILSKKLFNDVNHMDGKMLRNEDWDFVYNRMKKKNYKVFYSPKTIVYHENKKFSDFILKRFKYGYYMWPILLKFNLYNFYFLLPLFFSIFLLSFPLIIFNHNYQIFYLSIISIYLSVVLFEVVRISSNINDFIKIPFFIIPANLLPGFGIFFGLFKFIFDKFILGKDN